jgi:hypothetical protein
MYMADTVIKAMSSDFSGDSGNDSNPYSKISFSMA